MVLKLVSFFLLFLWSTCLAIEDSDALRECGNLHHLEFRGIPGAVGNFSNHECKLKCSVGEKTLSDDAINEGYPCPTNPYGICHNGQCIGSSKDALRECGNLHHIDFQKTNSHGSEYSDSQCFLRCAINGTTVSANAINEGFPCPENSHGICRNGHCVGGNNPATVAPPTRKPDSLFATHNLETVDVTVESASFPNRSVYYAYADFCLYDHENAQHLKTDQDIARCKRFCGSDNVRTKTHHPVFNVKCNLRNGLYSVLHRYVGLNATDTLIVKVTRYERVYMLAGHYEESLESIYERNHQKTKFSDTVPLKLYGVHVGDLNLKFDFDFVKKIGH